MAKIKLDLTNLSVNDLIQKLTDIAAAMTGNATFTSIAAKTTALVTAKTALKTANDDSEAANQVAAQKITLRDTARVGAEDAARTLAAAAEGVTSDAAELQSGGWDLRGVPTPVGPLPAPASLAATGGDQEGEVDLSWDAIPRGVQTFLAEQAPAPTGPWTQFYVGKVSKCTASGLTSGTQYWFRVRAVGAAGPGPWSDPATKRAT